MPETEQKKPIRIKKAIPDFPTAQRHSNHPPGSYSWLKYRRKELDGYLKKLEEIHKKHEYECEIGTGGGVERHFKERYYIDGRLVQFPKYSIEEEGGRKKMKTVINELLRELRDIYRRLGEGPDFEQALKTLGWLKDM